MGTERIKFEKECPVCGKIIYSSNGKPALKSYFKRHLKTHKLLEENDKR